MAIYSALDTTLGIIDAAASVLKNDTLKSGVGKVIGAKDKLGQTGGAITRITQQTTILSRVFIDDAVVGEPILPNVMRSVHEWYAAQIISALRLSSMVSETKKVQDLLSPVQSGHTPKKMVLRSFVGQEAFLTSYLGGAALEAFAYGPTNPDGTPTSKEDYSRWRDSVKDAQVDKDRQDRKDAEAKAIRDKENNVTIQPMRVSDNRVGPMGELYEVKLTNPNKDGQAITLPLLVQMVPSLIPSDIAPRFVDMNVSPTTWQRWTQRQAGEILFWKDFVFHVDQIKRHQSLLKDPKKAEAFSTFLKTIAIKDQYALADLNLKGTERQGSSNLANSVIILTEDTVAQAKVDSGIDLHNPNVRDRYFRDTYAMILVIVDPLHQIVTVYFNGLEGTVQAPYSEFRPRDSKFDPKDFLSVLQAFSSNSASRMR
jgi:hypothetical protein